MISRLEYVHSMSLIHRDIKPDNFVMGLGPRASQVYILDFGLSKKYRDPRTHIHIPYKVCVDNYYYYINHLNGLLFTDRKELDWNCSLCEYSYS